MEFIVDNFWTIAFIIILAGMGAPEISLSLIIAVLLLGNPPIWVLISCTIIGSLVRYKRIEDKNKSNQYDFHFTFGAENDKKDEGE